eukprot:GHVN01071212.1.p1 GENE.GHVN01071212.1~~GHVN01071212.1.p1  ORF type:complete len:117 (-),score=12.49 GHVN01071212.1:30-380(-)
MNHRVHLHHQHLGESTRRFTLRKPVSLASLLLPVVCFALGCWLALHKAYLCVLSFMFFLIFFISLLTSVVEESLLVIKNLGVQIERRDWKGGVRCRFIEIGQVKDVVINEARVHHL